MPKTLLFVGDSITEWGRHEDARGIGSGYVNEIYKDLFSRYPDWTVLNRGVWDDRIDHLEKRWEKDVLAIDPDVLSISIGVNEAWHHFDKPELTQVEPDQFEEIYHRILQQLHPKTALILMEPTIIEENPRSRGNQLLMEYVEIVRRLAAQYGAILVPAHAVFIRTLQKGNHAALTTDGVHLTDEGKKLLADAWKKAAGEIVYSNELPAGRK
ncbi:hydrolase [Jeotgalibacillus sp. S-D1]|uniref:SGNH/GDSL hydrolase family protein n=1 Tax=Jeotgalibacillus sp. S-D1 TaxID=2552189 RepID=UPI0010594601|nr:SGNH/GDSL hydrolase family protein [Jeotgalibacillus sp. S-D1]TDL32700.1 hydrolase [Jeotgalibacillus sp. S-D1]